MSAKVDQFCDNLRDRLNTMEARLTSFKTTVQALPEQSQKVVQAKLDEARHELQAQKEHIDQTRAGLEARVQEKLTETKEAIGRWKAKRETQKLNHRAERAEEYATFAIDFAAYAINEAEEAIL